MQNKFVGDVGDFGKYGLLRWLTGMTREATEDEERLWRVQVMHESASENSLQLGVVWYMQPDGGRGGGQIEYLTDRRNPRFRCCDDKLFFVLRGLVQNARSVNAIQECQILPIPEDDPRWYGERLLYPEDSTQVDRANIRDRWMAKAVESMEKANLVLIDPDNGIPCECFEPWSRTGPKYSFMDDLRFLVKKGKSLVIYHHFTRRHGTAEEEGRHFSHCLERELGLPVYALKYNRGTRFFFIVAQIEHSGTISERLASFFGSRWCSGRNPHFTWVG